MSTPAGTPQSGSEKTPSTPFALTCPTCGAPPLCVCRTLRNYMESRPTRFHAARVRAARNLPSSPVAEGGDR